MMLEPSLDEMLRKVDNTFTLVTVAMKRAKQLNSGAIKLVETPSVKPVTVALEEIVEGKIKPKKLPKDGN